MPVLTELRKRGVQDVLVACSPARSRSLPRHGGAGVHSVIVHMTRNSLGCTETRLEP